VRTYLSELARSKFALCPFGNGYDSYRLWECIYLGTIPILKASMFARNLVASGLPVAIVRDWGDVTPESLESAWARAQQADFCYDAAKLSWWKQRIRRLVLEAESHG
jgi:hypothetical protein